MPDYWIKISETTDEDLKHYHYLMTTKDEKEAKKSAMKFMERFVDDDEHPEEIDDGYTFCNKAVIVRLESVRDTTKEKFKEFLLKIHTIDMTETKTTKH
ncbi:MAG: hypothetical protein WCK00_15055 [Deltaproteobacteria bacterium]